MSDVDTEHISYNQLWQARIKDGITEIELCHIVRFEGRFHAKAWQLLLERKAAIGLFITIARSSLLYQPLACAHIVKNSSEKDELLFVAERPNPSALHAAKKLCSLYRLTQEEMKAVVEPFSEDQRIQLFRSVLVNNRYNCTRFEACFPKFYETHAERLHMQGISYSQMGEYGLKIYIATRSGKGRLNAAKKLLNLYPSRANFALVCETLATEETADLASNIAKRCVTRFGINWREACKYIPEHLTLTTKEYIEALIAVHNRPTALRTLLRRPNAFCAHAAATILNGNTTSTDDVILILRYAPHRYHGQAIALLLSRKGTRIAKLVKAWHCSCDSRPQIEREILRRRMNGKTLEYLSAHAPQLLNCLKHYPEFSRKQCVQSLTPD